MSKCDEFCDCKIGEDMGKIKDLAVAGVTDLQSYVIGKQDGERSTPGEQTREFYRRQGAERREQEILDLLGQMAISVCNCYECEAIREAIARIKGETK